MKRLQVLFVLLFTVFFTCNVITQDFGSIRGGYELTIPQKLHKLVLDPLPAGTYSVGTGGYFPTIDSAFNKLSIDGIAGEVILELTDNLYTAPTDSFGFQLIGPITGAGPNSRVTIKPAENKNVALEGNGRYVIRFLNTSYLTFDGVSLDGITTLTIHALYNSQFDLNRGVGFSDNSDHNIIQNLTYIGEDIYRYGDGIVVGTTLNSTAAPDSNLIQNNFIKKGGGGITLSGYFANGNVRPVGNIIRGNFIGSETDSLINWGMQIEKCQNTIIENNIIQNLKVTVTVGEILILGINSYWGIGDIIRNNIVNNIKSTTGYTSTGILLSGDVGNTGSDNLVYNNMVYDIQSSSTQGDSRVAGIQMWQQNNPKIYYNSVYLTGIGANHYSSGALYIWNTCSNVDAKNNIFVNTRDESPYSASAIYLQSTNAPLNSDYNDLFYDTTITNNYLVKSYSGSYYTLAEWQAAGKDSNSVTEMPNFVASEDLHIDGSIFTLIDGHATPITGIDTDIDGDIRNATIPDIGADEFLITDVEDETTLTTEFSLSQNYPNPFNPGTTFRYSIPQSSYVIIRVFDVLGNQIETLFNEEKPTGTYELTWNTANLPSGVYFYQLKAGEFMSTKKMILLK
jgi:hypothetical protein